MEKAGLPAPEYKDVAFMLNATIRNQIDAASDANGAAYSTSGMTSNSNDASVQTELSKNELLIYRFIKANPEASTHIIASSIKLSTRTVQRCISALLKKGIIENQGTRQHVKWSILEQK
ncbi:MAG: winged helix-turn-helix transcriptional regulator [Eubacterium sp.]|nr:winged helix-turn-helix transcriptional regulator [Eubacterium sp.]